MKRDTGSSSEYATGLIADSRFGYFSSCFCTALPYHKNRSKTHQNIFFGSLETITTTNFSLSLPFAQLRRVSTKVLQICICGVFSREKKLVNEIYKTLEIENICLIRWYEYATKIVCNKLWILLLSFVTNQVKSFKNN